MRFILVLVTILVFLNGCSNLREFNYKQDFLSYLEQRYKKEFVINNIDTSYLQLGAPPVVIANVSPTEDREIQFEVTQTVGYDTIRDTYLKIKWQHAISNRFENILNKYFDDNVIFNVSVGISIDFLKDYDSFTEEEQMISTVFKQSPGPLSIHYSYFNLVASNFNQETHYRTAVKILDDLKKENLLKNSTLLFGSYNESYRETIFTNYKDYALPDIRKFNSEGKLFYTCTVFDDEELLKINSYLDFNSYCTN